MRATAIKTCYACDQPATTKEHVPPFSFFPEGHRVNLITVPSCELHNNANSLDVEYTRNVISTYHRTNDVGENHFLDKAMKSFARSPALLRTTFADIRPIYLQGQEVGAFTMNVERVNAVFSACLTALHFGETTEKIQHWHTVLPNLGLTSDATREEVDDWRQRLWMFTQITFYRRQTSSPDVFQYAVADLPGGRVYSMTFYRAFIVFGLKAEVDGDGTSP